jgi:hypothetical protein
VQFTVHVREGKGSHEFGVGDIGGFGGGGGVGFKDLFRFPSVLSGFFELEESVELYKLLVSFDS